MPWMWKPVSIAICAAILSASPALTASSAPDVVAVGADHYRGRWLEIARTPMALTDGCVAGYSTYSKGRSPNEVAVEDGCHVGTPAGRLKSIHGTGDILDFATTKARMRVRYPFLITFNYWVLYKAPDQSWFISADPQMKNLWIYARSVPSKSLLRRMVRKAGELGYETRKLEFPPQ